MPLTITEALAELKTISKRIQKKQQFVVEYTVRQDMVKDPLEAQGGSVKAIIEERQAIGDLNARIVKIRAEIQKANAATMVTVGGITRSISDWLVWRRDVAPNVKAFLGGLQTALKGARNAAQQKGLQVRAQGVTDGQPTDLVVNIDERALAAESEAIEETLGTLDGLLSLKNATIIIDV